MAMRGNRRRKISVKRKIAITTGVVLAGVTAGGIAFMTAQSGTGSQYSLDDLRQQVLAMRPQVFEPLEQEEAPPEELHTSLKKRYAFAPRAFPAGNSLGAPLSTPAPDNRKAVSADLFNRASGGAEPPPRISFTMLNMPSCGLPPPNTLGILVRGTVAAFPLVTDKPITEKSPLNVVFIGNTHPQN